MQADMYLVKCVTNLHMGSGDINFNIVDNEVQRDPLTGFATMNSSGIKGALREFWKNNNYEKIDEIFGKIDENKSQAVNIKFTSGNLFFQAVRSAKGNELYYLVTTVTLLKQYTEMAGYAQTVNKGVLNEINNLSSEKAYVFSDEKEIRLEGKTHEPIKIDSCLKDYLKSIVDASQNAQSNVNKIIIIPDTDLRDISLPVIARNKVAEEVDDGNLWYEEIVPHESIFYFVAITDGKMNLLKDFERINKKLVQFGANATIGYGLTNVIKVTNSEINNK